MKYNALKNDIINILHSSDYGLQIKFYDENGNTTLDSAETVWCYIHNNNMLLEFPDDNSPELYIWKSRKNITNEFKNLIQRIRKISVINGVSVQIRMYDNLDQREIYNLIKTSLTTKQKSKSEKMNENMNYKKLQDAFNLILQTSKITNSNLDAYLSEDLKLQKKQDILNEIFSEIKSLQNIKKIYVDDIFNKLSIASTYNDIKNIIESIDDNIKNILIENSNLIYNACLFVKNSYNNVCTSNKPTTIFILENVKVYKEKEFYRNQKLAEAFNKLLSLSSDCKSGIDILRIIKANKLCETFSVSKNELLNLMLVRNNPIKDKYNFVIETTDGKKHYFEESLMFGIKTLAHHINNGGDSVDIITSNIISETKKYNEISSFIKEYKDNFRVRPFITKFENMFVETINKLSSTEFNKSLFESVEHINFIDYAVDYNRLCSEMGVEHNAIKYLAVESYKEKATKESVLLEEKINDITLLSNGLKSYSENHKDVATFIVENKINTLVEVNVDTINCKNAKSFASEIYNKICEEDTSIVLPISSSLFNIIHTKQKLNEDKISYLNTLRKYLI